MRSYKSNENIHKKEGGSYSLMPDNVRKRFSLRSFDPVRNPSAVYRWLSVFLEMFPLMPPALYVMG